MPIISQEEISVQVARVLPDEQKGYFEDTERKHFDPEAGAGSIFTEVKSLPELLALAIRQRGDLEGDDREQFIALGVNPESLLTFCRYLKVNTGGEIGIKSTRDLSPDTKVKVIRMKRGAPCSLIIESNDFPKTDFGTIIIGPNEKSETTLPDDPEQSTEEMVWTVHPGLPIRPSTGDLWLEGSEITVRDVVKKYGFDVFLNVRKTG